MEPVTTLNTDEEVNEYLGTLLKGKAQVSSPVEEQALQAFKNVSGRVDTLEANLQRSQSQVDQFKAQVNEASGEMKAYVTLLVGAERARRKLAEVEAQGQAQIADQKAKDEAAEPSSETATAEETEPEPSSETTPTEEAGAEVTSIDRASA